MNADYLVTSPLIREQRKTHLETLALQFQRLTGTHEILTQTCKGMASSMLSSLLSSSARTLSTAMWFFPRLIPWSQHAPGNCLITPLVKVGSGNQSWFHLSLSFARTVFTAVLCALPFFTMWNQPYLPRSSSTVTSSTKLSSLPVCASHYSKCLWRIEFSSPSPSRLSACYPDVTHPSSPRACVLLLLFGKLL